MKKSVLLFAVILAAACQPKAMEQEIEQMCKNLLVVRGEMKTFDQEEIKAKIEEEYKAKEKHLTDWKAREMAAWNNEMNERIKELEEKEEDKKDKKEKKDEDPEDKITKESITKEYEKRKEIGAQQFDKDIEELNPAKEKALKDALEKIALDKDEMDKKTAQCIEDAKKEKVSQKLAQCRIEATDADTYWNRCR